MLPCLAEQVLGGIVKAVTLEAAKGGEKWREVERSGEDKAQSESVEREDAHRRRAGRAVPRTTQPSDMST